MSRSATVRRRHCIALAPHGKRLPQLRYLLAAKTKAPTPDNTKTEGHLHYGTY